MSDVPTPSDMTSFQQSVTVTGTVNTLLVRAYVGHCMKLIDAEARAQLSWPCQEKILMVFFLCIQVGTNQLTYNVKDRAGNTAVSQVRTVTVTDTRKPIILLIGSNMAIEAGSTFTDPGCRVLDEVCLVFTS